eukprot:SAG31_NODE_6820_length_1878_cov_1.353569_2_plen_114_part_00
MSVIERNRHCDKTPSKRAYSSVAISLVFDFFGKVDVLAPISKKSLLQLPTKAKASERRERDEARKDLMRVFRVIAGRLRPQGLLHDELLLKNMLEFITSNLEYTRITSENLIW